jgi:gamma-glutamyltranspeptidase / glutathione hydrolase
MATRATIAADGSVIAARGVVATSEPQAAEVGASVLRAGGNAVDAALATAACLTVTEPTGNGLGGDLLALIFDGETIRGLEAVGHAPAALTLEEVRRLGHREMPLHGWLPVTAPGQVAGWGALHEAYGSMPMAELLAPAIRLGRQGCLVSPVIAAAWRRAAEVHGSRAAWREVFMPKGQVPAAGETFRNPALANSLELIAQRGAKAFYDELGERIVRHAADTGGYLGPGDLRSLAPRWVEPLACDYGPYRLLGAPAPTQGAIALEALGILDGLAGDGADEITRVHRAIEATKLAFADGYAALADPTAMRLDPSALLDPAHLARRRAQIHDDRAGPSPARAGLPGGTVLVCAGDAEGRLISLLQSNFHGFGSGIVVPGTGISLHNRGAGFSLDPRHPNALAPGKRPFHTLLPGMLASRDDGALLAAYGCMGGQMQPQGHVQLVASLAAGAAPQTALARPRWRWLDSGAVLLEEGFDPELAAALEALGHSIQRDGAPRQFGGAQLVMRRPAGGLIAASDPRKGGAAVPA